MKIVRNEIGISISQQKYVLDPPTKTGMLGSRLVDTPMDPNVKFSAKDNDIPAEKGRYRKLVGKLIYLAHTRPGIAFAVSYVKRFMHSPSEVSYGSYI